MSPLINPSDAVPIYRQIMRHVTDAIAGGRLKAGDKLASHRELSEELVVAPLTVKKAYDELEALGYIETHRGRGTFVCERLPSVSRAAQQLRLRDEARTLISTAMLAGLSVRDVEALIGDVHRELTDGSATKRRRA